MEFATFPVAADASMPPALPYAELSAAVVAAVPAQTLTRRRCAVMLMREGCSMFSRPDAQCLRVVSRKPKTGDVLMLPLSTESKDTARNTNRLYMPAWPRYRRELSPICDAPGGSAATLRRVREEAASCRARSALGGRRFAPTSASNLQYAALN